MGLDQPGPGKIYMTWHEGLLVLAWLCDAASFAALRTPNAALLPALHTQFCGTFCGEKPPPRCLVSGMPPWRLLVAKTFIIMQTMNPILFPDRHDLAVLQAWFCRTWGQKVRDQVRHHLPHSAT
jgi:hypothetical protein